VRVRFGINYMPTGSPLEVVRWARLVEELKYEILGISDSQSICRDVYMTLALCAVNTERIRLGPRVITPVTRHPAVAAGAAATLEELAPKRTLLGLGSGDSAALGLPGCPQHHRCSGRRHQGRPDPRRYQDHR
jgi:5,10-methylenetetrahydromethanopterin reductase